MSPLAPTRLSDRASQLEHGRYSEDRLPRPVDAPALILAGRHDVATGYRDAWPLMADLPRASYAFLDGAGHGVEAEQPALFRALAGDWLDRGEGWRAPV